MARKDKGGDMRRLLVAILLLLMAGTVANVHAQETYPTRVVKIVVGYPGGTSSDILARIYAQKLSERFGQQFIVENRPGASGTLGSGSVARAVPDGYTLLLCVQADAIEASAKDLTFNFAEDFSPIAAIASLPIILVVRPDLGVSSVKDLIALAKRQPEKIFYGSAGIGSTPHMAGELFNYMSGTKLVHVPYKGIPAALIDLLGGRIQAVFATAPTVAGYINDGRLKALATTSAKRSSLAPNIPTMAEAGINGYDVAIWYGFVAPKRTPEPIRRALAEAIVAANAQPDVQKQLANIGAEPLFLTLEKYGTFIHAEVKKWKTVVDYAGISLK